MKKVITQLFFYVDGKEYPTFLGDLNKVEFIPRVGEKVKFPKTQTFIVDEIIHSYREDGKEIIQVIEIRMLPQK